MRDYQPIKPMALDADIGYAQPTQSVLEHVRIDSPALDVMTDLTRVAAVIILPGDPVDEAHRRMIQRGVLSATQIARQLGITISTELVARTFADIEASLGH